MAIDPKLVSIKKAGDLPSGIPTPTGEFLYFEDETLKKAEMSDLYDRVESAYLGIITPSITIPSTGSWYGDVLAAGTFNNVTPAITVDVADFDVENGMANNEVRIIISDGVASKDVRRVKGDKGDAADPAKLPLYSAIKSANIVAGTQFINDEDGDVVYRAIADLAVGENPADFVNIKVVPITITEPTNLYNPATDKVDFTINNIGNSVASIGNKHSAPIKISPLTSYTIGRFIQNSASLSPPFKLLVFQTAAGTKIDSTASGWGTYYLHTAVGDSSHKFDYYELVPASEIAVDWKTNGQNKLPIPANAASFTINTVFGAYNIQETFGVFKQGQQALFQKYKETQLDYFNDALINFLKKITIPNYFSQGVARKALTLNLNTGLLGSQGDVGGLQYQTSDYIDVSGADVWYLQGRNSTDKAAIGSRGFAWFTEDLVPIKPIDENGNNLNTYYALNSENGKVYRPSNAKYALFNSLWKSSLELSPNIMFTPYTKEIEQNLSYGEYIVNMAFLFANKDVANGQIMIKDGDSFTGIDQPIPNDYDGIYRIINFLATAITKTQQIHFEHVNTLPNDAEPRMVFHAGKLKFVQNGIAKEFNLI